MAAKYTFETYKKQIKKLISQLDASLLVKEEWKYKDIVGKIERKISSARNNLINEEDISRLESLANELEEKKSYDEGTAYLWWLYD